MKRLQLLIIPIIIVLLVGCSAFGYSATSPRQHLAVADIAFTNVIKTVTAGVQAGTISQADGRRILPIAEGGNAALEAAHDAVRSGAGDDVIIAYINTALAIIEQLKSLVDERTMR